MTPTIKLLWRGLGHVEEPETGIAQLQWVRPSERESVTQWVAWCGPYRGRSATRGGVVSSLASTMRSLLRVSSRQVTGKPRPRTFSARGNEARDRELIARLDANLSDEASESEPAPPRPRTRGECADGPRPCPWISCRYHLWTEETDHGSLKIVHPDITVDELDRLPDTCALDVADRGEHTLETVAVLTNVTRERIRQVEANATRKIRHRLPLITAAKAAELSDDHPTYPHTSPHHVTHDARQRDTRQARATRARHRLWRRGCR